MTKPHVVYHVTGLGCWKDIVTEQLRLLREVGLHDADIRITHAGHEKEWLAQQLKTHDISAAISRYDQITDRHETLAFQEIEKIAKIELSDRPIAFIHTLGCVLPTCRQHQDWRRLMDSWVIKRWKSNVRHLESKDVVGVNWQEKNKQNYGGGFWIANPNWIRNLPDFATYLSGFDEAKEACEAWIGSTKWCDAISLACANEPFLNPEYNCLKWLPRPRLSIVQNNLFSGDGFGQIFTHFNSDKDSDHSYGEVYSRLFPISKRSQVKSVLEIGVQAGHSMLAWEKAFYNAKIFGIDINYQPQQQELSNRSQVVIANATDPQQMAKSLRRLGIEEKSLDLIIDDASHKFADQAATLAILAKYLSPDGCYVIEDVYPFENAEVLVNALRLTMLPAFSLDRRGVKNRFDDVLVIAGAFESDFDDLMNPPQVDIRLPV